MAAELTFEQALKEVWVYLQTMQQRYISAIPEQILKNIEDWKDDDYDFELADEAGSNLSTSACVYLDSLNYQFWCSEDEKRELIRNSENLQRAVDLEAYDVLVDEIENYMHAYPFDLLDDTDYQHMQQGCSEAMGILRTLAASILSHIPKSHILLLRLNRDPKVQVILEDLSCEPFPPVSLDCMKILADIYCRYLAMHEFTPEDIEYGDTVESIEAIIGYLTGKDPENSEPEQNPIRQKLDYYKKLAEEET